MLYRNAQKIIEKWISNGTKPLLISGARQIGKTYLIKELLKKSNKDYVEINLIENEDAASTLNSALEDGIDLFMKKLSLLLSRQITEDTILFIDEVQEAKDFLTMVKFLTVKNKFKIIMSGSLLGIELKNLKSAPVGFLDTCNMYPLDFYEFAKNLGLQDDIIEYLKDCFDEKKPVDEIIHKKLLETFSSYLIVGGMPEAVQCYLDTNDFSKVRNIHSQIELQYKNDFTKYESLDKRLKLIKTYDLIPSELNSKNSRFVFTDIDKDFKFDRYENSFNWLIDAGVAIPTYNATDPVVPLEINKKNTLFKLFLSDIGMLTSKYGTTTQLKILNNEDDINYGSPYENAICEELLCHGFKTYYFNNKKLGEVDFLIEWKDKVLPIEVKSGKDYTVHSALDNLVSTKSFNINEAFVLCNSNIQVSDKITYLPIYMIMFLVNNNDEVKHEKINLKELKLNTTKEE